MTEKERIEEAVENIKDIRISSGCTQAEQAKWFDAIGVLVEFAKSQLSHESKGVGVEDIENIITQALVSNTFWCEQCKGDGTIFTGSWDEFKRQIRVSCSNCDGHGFYMDKLAQAIHALLATKGG